MILINKKENVFHMQTKNLSYIISVNKETGQILTQYFGAKLNNRPNQGDISKHFERPFSSYIEENKNFSLDSMQLEFSTLGFSDYRDSTIELSQNNEELVHFTFKSAKTEKYSDKSISGLPLMHDGIKTLVITLEDKHRNIEIDLKYTPVDDSDVFVKNLYIRNSSKTDVTINKALSSSTDFLKTGNKIITLNGSWARERNVYENNLKGGTFRIDSNEGISSSKHNPFLALAEKDTNEFAGNVYGFSLIYSSNFEINCNINQYKNTRVSLGINSNKFKWKLKPGEVFETPQAVLTFSSNGYNQMSQNFHSFIKDHISPKQWTNEERPILINNWEATYFDFTEDKIVEMAKKASEVGIELFCLDDGWFGQRDSETSSLGDWFENKKKLPGGLKSLADKINKLNMKFGIWIEPEMISEKSDLFKAHPDWALVNKNYPIVRGRNQLVLDMSNKEVVDYLIKIISNMIDSANISYVKWDMNRPLSHQTQAGYEHKYVLGFYRLARTLTKKYPNILFEGCSAGGNRFDMGALKYFPQIWTSDDTDAYERVKIQYGTSFVYPQTVISNHVSAVPNHQIKRTTDLKSRIDVSNLGIMGYELDLLKATEAELKEIKSHIETYKMFRKMIMSGDFYRLQSPFEHDISGMQIVSKNKKLAIGVLFKSLATPNPFLETVRLKGLDRDMIYMVPTTDYVFSGDELIELGLFLPPEMAFGDFKSQFYVLSEKGSFNNSKVSKIKGDVKTLIRTKRA